MLLALLAFATNGSANFVLTINETAKTTGYGYATVTTVTDRSATLKQCTPAIGPMGTACTGTLSVAETPEGLAAISAKLATYTNPGVSSISLGSNIDFKGFDPAKTAAGTCVQNYEPISLPASVTSIYGGGYSFKNFCHVSTDAMTKPVGIFETLNNSQVENFKITGARIVVNAGSNGASYYPVGALVGHTSLSTIKKITLADIEIDAPLAGGLAGFVENSTIDSIFGDNDIVVQNTNKITTGYAGSQELIKTGSANVKLYMNSYGYKVALGGLVGVTYRTQADNATKYDASFLNDSLKVTVQNLAEDVKSAVGGISGVYSASNDTISNVKIYTKVKTNESIPSKISGGSAMGGLFGLVATHMSNGSAVNGRVVLRNSSFAGELGDSRSSKEEANVDSMMVFIGGLVGRNSITHQSAFKMKSVRANVAIKDSISVAGNYRYSVGGLLGSMVDCSNGATTDTYLTITGSNVSGSIDVAASASAVDGLNIQTYVGGVAGRACIDYDGNGLKNDTSSVDISVRVKSANTSSQQYFSKLVVGGIVGYANSASIDPLLLSNLRYTGSISVEDSLSSVAVGGIAGAFSEVNGGAGTSVHFKNVSVENADVIKYVAKKATNVSTVSKPQVAKIGGICGLCNEMYAMDMGSVVGDITVDGKNYAGDTLVVGGIVGSVHNNAQSMLLRNTYSRGDITVTGNTSATTPTVVRTGYVVGDMLMGSVDYSVMSNYHYGLEDASVDAFGYVSIGGNKSEWENDTKFVRIFRNGDAGTDEDRNGTKSEEQMMTDEFAKLLNTDQSTLAWSRDEKENLGLPIFIDAVHSGLADCKDADGKSVSGFTVTFLGMDGKSIAQRNVCPEKTVDTPDAPEIEGYEFIGWSDNFNDETTVTSTMYVSAEYKILTYEVRFWNEDSSKVIYENLAVEHGSAVIPPDPEDKQYAEYFVKEDFAFVGWTDSSFNNVTKDLDIYPKFASTLVYFTVSFLDKEGMLIESSQQVKYGEAATAPDYPVVPGWTFKGWDKEFQNVVSDLNVQALYTQDSFTVVFNQYDGTPFYTKKFAWGDNLSSAGPMEHPATIAYTYTFKKWDTEPGYVYSDTVFSPVYDSTLNEYTITFKNRDGSLIGEPKKIGYGLAIDAPEAPAVEGSEFIGWSEDLSAVTGDMSIFALYKTLPVSSSSVAESSSSEPESSSSVVESSSSEPESSSSVIVVEKVEVAADIKQAGNAIRLEYTSDKLTAELKTEARVVVVGENGLLLDTLLTDSLTEAAGAWELVPAPFGKYSVYMVVSNDSIQNDTAYSAAFEVNSEILVNPKSWQMLSIAALDMKNLYGDEEVAFYWWDEQNPIGDYWQYRSYDERQDYDATLGFWYGTMKGEPLFLREETPSMDSEITWELDSLYSGWNLVANPHGWRVDLKSGNCDNVKFWRWNADNSGYEQADYLNGYEAVWAKVSAPVTCTVSSKPAFTIRKQAGLAKASAAGDWNIQVTLSDDFGKSDSWNILGAGEQAESWEEPPEGMGDHVNLSIVEDGEYLAKSVKASADEYSWDMEVSAFSDRDGYLTFAGVDALAKSGMHMYVTVDGKTTEVAGDGKVKVALTKSAKQVNVRVAQGPAVKAVSSAVSGLRTRQVANLMNVGFEVSADLNGAKARVALIGVDGKAVVSKSLTVGSGNNTVSLDAPKSGLYYVRVQVASQVAAGKVIVK